MMSKAPAIQHQSGTFTLPPLPYSSGGLEPVIDRRTMDIHHDKHHASYVKKLNDAVASAEAVVMSGIRGTATDLSLEMIIKNASKFSSDVRNNAGGHYNHSVFWMMMAPPEYAGKPSAELLEQISTDFGSLEELQTDFNKAGAAHFGSGWVWLIWADGKLKITTLPNQDNPLMDDVATKGEILLLNDVWEHAYYLMHQNKRDDYLKDWWGIVNWDEVNKRFEDAAT